MASDTIRFLVMVLQTVMFTSLFYSIMGQGASQAQLQPAEQEERHILILHETDSLTILMLIALLLITILTVWLFKHHRLRFVHETGLSMIYGLIVGALIRYTSPPSDDRIGTVLMAPNASNIYSASQPPDALVLRLTDNFTNTTKEFQFDLKGEVEHPGSEDLLEARVTFDPELFFNVFLPIIIFNAGFSMKRRHFFKNLGAIIAYAFVGTTISCLVVGGIMFGLTRLFLPSFTLSECFFFGAIISATDPVTVLAIFHDLNVDVDLYAMVFGESVLNDAVAIVLASSIETYSNVAITDFTARQFFSSLGTFCGIFSGAFVIGAIMGCITALMTKYTQVRDFPLLESGLFFLMSYSTFQAAEAAGFTGIVAVLFCGITQAHYTFNNLSAESKIRTKQLFELLNFLAENFVFLYIGVSIFTFQKQRWNPGFIFAGFLGILVARFCNVYPLSFLLNLGRSNKIKMKIQHMMMFSGLRGAIAFALAIRNTATESRQIILSATMIIVLATVILCGGFTTPMLQWLQIRVGVEDEKEEFDRNAINRQKSYRSMSSPVEEQCVVNELRSIQSPEDISKENKRAWLVAKWYTFDTKFMKPFLTHSRPCLTETLPTCCMPLAKLLTTEEQLIGHSGNKADDDSDTDMIIDPNELSYGDNASNNSFPLDLGQPGQISDDALGDLGLGGHNAHPLNVQVHLSGTEGEKV